MQLRAHEAAVVEKAVRLAIESVMNVLCAVNSARTHELQRLVADRERQIQRLEGRVRETEAELRLLLRRPSSPGPVPDQRRSSAEPESSAEQRESGVRVSLALLTGPPSQDAPEAVDLDQTGSSSDQSVSAAGDQPQLCPGLVQPEQHCPGEDGHVRESSRPTDRQVKQERLYPSPGRIKLEPLSPEYAPLHQDAVDSPAVFLQRGVSDDVSPRIQGVLGLAEPWQSASSQAEDAVPVPHAAPVQHAAPVPHAAPVQHTVPVPHSAAVPHTVPWKSRTSVSRRDQSEEAMRRRRASWRAASRRYYARKMARLQTHTSSLQNHPNSLQSHMNTLQSHASCPGSGPQYPSCSGAPGSHTETWRYPVCELAPLHHQPPPASSDVTFMTDSDLLGGSLT